MKAMLPDMAPMICIPSGKVFSWQEMAKEQEKQKTLLIYLICRDSDTKRSKTKEALEAEKPNEASEAEKTKKT